MINSSFEKRSSLKSQKIRCLPPDTRSPTKKKNAFVLCSLKIIIIYLSELEEIKYIHSNFLQTLLPLRHFCICVTWFQIKRVSFFLWKDHSNSITRNLIDHTYLSLLNQTRSTLVIFNHLEDINSMCLSMPF